MGTTTLSHNGITVEPSEPLGSIGGVEGQYGGLIGTVNALKPNTQYSIPITLYGKSDLVKLDETSTLYHAARFVIETARVPVDVICVPKGSTADETEQNLIGGVDATDGQLLGLEAFNTCKTAPTNIGVVGKGTVGIGHALAGVVDKLKAEGWISGSDTNTEDAKAFGMLFGDAHKRVWAVDVSGERWNHVIPPAVYGMAARLSVKPWKTPSGQPLKLDDLARTVGYETNDPASEAVALNKVGVSLAVPDPEGGIMFLGHRTLSGAFGNIVGMENQLIRGIVRSHRQTMSENLDLDFFKGRIAQLNNWLSSLESDGAHMGARVYLHPERNNLERYKNGEWVLVIDWGAYRPNEHSIVELNQSDAIVKDFLGNALK
ncbi:hypothetical protein HC752_21865 [Vibrio sp. S9_S30]|uniref:hypothetical protein n=1 Tax=Vibrio sp. S9_S30 TaxID=2720226 RepID=UPI0016816F65|nr:hypothetical protein [Vibrio sp. S9_S30]MBD1559594.1 hypothetical protein [Vibrio sp. S9_S30]